MLKFKSYEEILEYASKHPFSANPVSSLYCNNEKFIRQFVEKIKKEYFTKTNVKFDIRIDQYRVYNHISLVDSNNIIGFRFDINNGTLHRTQVNPTYADHGLNAEILEALYREFIVEKLGVNAVKAYLPGHIAGIVNKDLEEFEAMISSIQTYKTNKDKQVDETITTAISTLKKQFILKINDKIAHEYLAWTSVLDKANNFTV